MTGRADGRSAPRLSFRRLWPRKVRNRLAVTYALLFLISGSVLLGLTYVLVSKTVPSSQPGAVMSQQQYATLCKNSPPQRSASAKPQGGKKPSQPQPTASGGKQITPSQKIAQECQQAYQVGQRAGVARARTALGYYSLLGLGLMTIVSAAAGWVVSGRVLRPVRAITDTARRASAQHLGERLALAGPEDELKELSDTFDDMLDRLDQAFSGQRRFVANASHELRTPLTVMRTAIDVTLAKPGRTAEQLESMAVRVRHSIERAERMVDALLTLAVSDQGCVTSRELVDLATAAEDALDATTAEAGRLALQVDAELQPAVATGDQRLLERLIGNLVENAVRHNEPGGWIRLRAGTAGNRAFFQITNGGRVIPDTEVPGLFEPFRRLDGRVGGPEGAGLGLSIAKAVAAAHGAVMQARSHPGGGLDVTVTLPAG